MKNNIDFENSCFIRTISLIKNKKAHKNSKEDLKRDKAKPDYSKARKNKRNWDE